MKKHLLTVLTLTMASGIAWAGSDKISFQELDTNGDGVISRDEAKKAPAVKAKFDQVDANRDGQLDMAEFAALEAVETLPKDTR
jgi:Ca2+-binding EF-hand superfamily protein